ncbi:B12-binding domain-containing radical SAM protein [bacterium]|nr:B12-binding domain-containing radical SAM protein [candidate division CSSED10-310 bacterium]
MRILLISPYSDIASLGMRIIAASARDAGHRVSCAFLPNTPSEERRLSDTEHTYPEPVLEILGALARDADLVGVTLMTNYLARTRKISREIRNRSNTTIVWGGIHPTIRPSDGMEYADYCIIGEGEQAFLELLDCLEHARDCTGIPNLAGFRNGRLWLNPPRDLIQDLDGLPFPDYGPGDHYIWDRESGGLVPMSGRLLEKHLARGPISLIRNEVTYQTISTRGCPHRCAYCCNDVLQALYRGQKHLRRRSDENVLEELKSVRQSFPFIRAIGFSDDSFFAATEERIEAFAARYRSEIGLPFFCLGSPLTITSRKMEALLDAGMYGLQMGVQSGSPRIQKIYNRPISNEKVLQAVELLHRYRHRMVPPSYDFIIDSPWENPDDLNATLALIRRFPRPYRLQLFSLVIFPETTLYHLAVKEGWMQATESTAPVKEYHERKARYVNLVLSAYRYPVWKPLLDFLSHPRMVRWFDRPLFNRLYAVAYRAGRWLNRRLFKNR